jgi:pantoate--beta-alanine ligase
MQKIESVGEMRSLAAQWRREGRLVALVPTSGALHAGHAALITEAKAKAHFVVVSCFVNPLAFGPNEYYSAYPRQPEGDAKLAAELGADILFTPKAEEFYPRGYSTFLTEEMVSKPLCGISRPTHFRGVATGMLKLLNIVAPSIVMLGQRDAQQVAVMRKIVADLCLPVEIEVAPVVRDADGLVVSVKSPNLTTGQRQEAVGIQAALVRGQEMVRQGVRSPDRVIAEVTHLLGSRNRVRVIYITIVDSATMEPMREIVPGRSLLAVAVWIDEVRLIDNVIL